MAPMSRITSATFVGRGAELDILSGALDRAADGRPAFAFVGGESGVGKTRLLREFESRARERGARVLLGQCLELGGAQIPYAPLVGALRPLARGLAGDEAETLPASTRNALAELLPELGGTGIRADEEASARQGRLFEALLTLLARLGRSAPVLLAIEDLHWADGSTRDFITFLVRSAREEPLCLVVTYRSDELHRRHPLRPLLAELERAAGVERLALERFDRGELSAQLEGILQAPAPAELADRLFARSEGNPLYTEELLAASEDGGCGMLPETLRDALLARIERLAPAAQAVVRVAAVLDRPVTHALLEAVAELTPAEVMEGAREAVAHQVLVAGAEGTYAFRHALVGEAVHEDLLPGEDTALHARIAEAIEARPELLGDVTEATAVAELACHWRAAHELSRSLGASVRAGFAAKRVYAYDEGQRQFERALELWERVPDAQERAGIDRVEVLRHAATCAGARGEGSRAVALIREALAGLDEDADPLRAALLYRRLGHFLRQTGAGGESFAAFDRAVALLPAGPSAERARVLEERARVEMLMGDFTQAQATVKQSLAEARAAGAELTEVRALNTLGFTCAGLGDEAEGIATLREAYARASEVASPADCGRAAVNLSEVLDLAGHGEEALAVVRTEITAARKRPERTSFDAFILLQEVHLLMRLGRLAEARERMPTRVPGEAVSYTGIYWHDLRARLALLAGNLAALREDLEALRRLSESSLEPQWIEPRTDMEVELAVRDDRLTDARELVRRAAPRIEHSDEATRLLRMAWMAQRVEAEAAGRAHALGEAYEPVLDGVAAKLRERAELRPRFDEACAWGGMATAELQRRRTLLGDAPADASPWLEVAAAFDAIRLPIPATYARFRAAEALVTGGDRAGASVPLRAAAAVAAATGAALIAGDIAALARRARIDLRDADDGDGAGAEPDDSPVARLGLTPRELEVLLLVAEGRTNRVIGETLFMSEKTASVHVSRILAKLGVGGRVEAAAVAHRLGLTAAAAVPR
jgi:DNA-binding CsgD family transcriptional regulator/tetratricopeptide (TPR) repeat protein